MKRLSFLIALLAVITLSKAENGTARFDFDWLFHLCTDSEVAVVDANQLPSGWNWTAVQLPHDWNTETEWDKTAGNRCGFQKDGVGWYRKTFDVPMKWKGDKVSIIFDGVHQDCTVFLNGTEVCRHFYGFTSFEVDLTPCLKYGAANQLAVRVNHDGYARWYTGSGINRHAWLRHVNPVHVKYWGTYVTTPTVTDSKADVKIVTTVTNASPKSVDVRIVQTLKDAMGKTLKQTETKQSGVAPGDHDVEQTIELANPHRWDISDPYRYELVTTVKVQGKISDTYVTRFGVRTLEFSPEKGFFLNGKNMKLKGMCVHQDAGIFGSAIPDRMQERRYSILKEFGVNAIRFSHNPPAPEALEVCDSLGLLVIDECFDKWTEGYYGEHYGYTSNVDEDGDPARYQKVEEAIKQELSDFITRDRNHPCIILWSIANEIAEARQKGNEGVERAKRINDYVHQLEPTRKTILALQPGYVEKFALVTDVIGYNYGEKSYLADKKKHPQLMGIITESYPYYSSLRPYESRDYSTRNPWYDVEENDFLMGSFMWAGIDYWGESSGWPSKGWSCSPFDMSMEEKPWGAYFRSVWKPEEPVLKLALLDYNLDIAPGKDHWQLPPLVHDWTLPYTDERVLPVYVMTNCDSVLLYDTRGRKFGPRSPRDYENNTIVWNQPYRPGRLLAIGYKDGVEVARDSIVTTAKQAAGFTLTADRQALKADGMDYAFVDVQLKDESGNPIRVDDRRVSVAVDGAGEICGINSMEMRRQEKMNSKSLPTKFGRCQIVVKSQRKAGPITLNVKVEGLQEQRLELTAK